MATEKQVAYIKALAKYAPARAESAFKNYGDDLEEMSVAEARDFISELVGIKEESVARNEDW